MSDDMKRILAKLERLEQGQERLEQGQNSLRVDVMARMDRLQEGFIQLRSEIEVNFANTERVDRRAQSAHDEIRLVMEMVTEMVRSMRRLETRVGTLESGS